MRFRDLYKMAKENLLRRKLRTGLTILSIIIGTTSIILMIALGLAMQGYVMKEFNSYGSVSILYVSKKQEKIKKSRFYETELVSGLTDSDVSILNQMEGIEYNVPLSVAQVNIYTKDFSNNVTMVGIDPYFMDKLGFQLKEGRMPGVNAYEMIFGEKILESFKRRDSNNPNAVIKRPERYNMENRESEEDIEIDFGGEKAGEYAFAPMEERYKLQFDLSSGMGGEQIFSRLFSLNGVGILKEGDSMKDNHIFMPFNIYEKLLRSVYEAAGMKYKTSYAYIMVKVKDLKQVKTVSRNVEKAGYTVDSLMTMLDSTNKIINIIKIVLGAIGGIALLVAAIGITNTMVMAITERKKEIGIMKVIGATILDIKRLFLLEAAMIGCIGGALGIMICIGISGLVNSSRFMKAASGPGFTFHIPLTLAAAGLIFTTLIGLSSGYLPALKAMKSSALEAIKNE